MSKLLSRCESCSICIVRERDAGGESLPSTLDTDRLRGGCGPGWEDLLVRLTLKECPDVEPLVA